MLHRCIGILQTPTLFSSDTNDQRLLMVSTGRLQLVDWTGRIIRDDKRGAIGESTPPILQRLDISTDHWIELSTEFESRFKGIAGSPQSIKALCAHFGLTRQLNRSNSEVLYG